MYIKRKKERKPICLGASISIFSISLSSFRPANVALPNRSFPLLPTRQRHYPSQSPVSCPFFPASHFALPLPPDQSCAGFFPSSFFLSFFPSLSLSACLSACQTLILRGKASYISPVSSFKPFRRSPPSIYASRSFSPLRFPRDKKRTKLEPEPEKQDATGISLFPLKTVSGKNKKEKKYWCL